MGTVPTRQAVFVTFYVSRTFLVLMIEWVE